MMFRDSAQGDGIWHPYHFLADAALVGRGVLSPVVVDTVAGRIGPARFLALGSRLPSLWLKVDLDVTTAALTARKRDKARLGRRPIALPSRAVALRAGCYRTSVANPEAAGRRCVRAASVWNDEPWSVLAHASKWDECVKEKNWLVTLGLCGHCWGPQNWRRCSRKRRPWWWACKRRSCLLHMRTGTQRSLSLPRSGSCSRTL